MSSNSNGLNIQWVGISIVIFLLAQVGLSVAISIFGILTLGIGLILYLIIKPLVFFVGGFITGAASPGITIAEPAIGAAIVSVAGSFFAAGAHRKLGLFGVILGGVLAFIFALMGAKAGEKFQGNKVD